ncbi:cytoplasmic tRNA 2-thiolation protein 2 [Anthonomus grandis grandis]|uniref:cytoplasmic tRNA 2-thiolation protein 2 n=1 Tax=Anthonomus grandis grandis TaxID=2921223 RepID=UPI002165D0AD|nr:cytoplasmic tRNA 2-thiolation protein 2 [Anthonomus grandis grandis]
MCSVGDDFETEGEKHMPQFKNLTLSSLKCNKCREEIPVVLLRHKDAYCRTCFLAGTNHKFKGLLGKSKLIRPKDRVLVSYSTGHQGTALLHLLKSGIDLSTPKKLRFEPVFVFVEDQYHLNVKEREEMVTKVIKEASSYHFTMHLVSFADSIKCNDINIFENCIPLNENDNERIGLHIEKSTSLTNRKELLNIMKRNVLISAARKLKCNFIFTTELLPDIASNLLTNVALGRGSLISVESGFCDDRDENIKILRPLRCFDLKELAFYNVIHGIEPVSIRQPLEDNFTSIQSLMGQFINNLQESFSATITTVVKTGDKLATDDKRISGKCKVCQGSILTKTDDLKSEESTKFSRLVSNEVPDHSLSRKEKYNKIINRFTHSTQKPIEYCYACSKLSDYLLNDLS